MFTATRIESWKEAKRVKCSRFEALALHAPLCYFVQGFISPAWPKHCACFTAMCDMFDAFHNLLCGAIAQAFLKARARDFLNESVEAGWRPLMHPKLRWLTRAAPEFTRHGSS